MHSYIRLGAALQDKLFDLAVVAHGNHLSPTPTENHLSVSTPIASHQPPSGRSATPSLATNTTLAGIGFMIAGVSMFPIMNAFAKTLTADFPLWQVTWARFSGHLLITMAVFMPRRGLALFKTEKPLRQGIRSVVFFASNACFIGALPFVSLATASSIMFTAPVIVTALSVWFLGERVGAWRWSAVIIGLTGAVIIIRPGTESFNAATLLVLCSAFCYSIYQLLTRTLTTSDAADTQIIYTAVAGAAITTFIVPFVGTMPQTPLHWASFCALGCFGAIAHFCVIEALKRATASVVAPLGYVELITATALGYLVFGDFPDSWTWAGAALIVVSGLVIAYRQARASKSANGRSRAVTYYLPEFMIGCGLLMVLCALVFNLLP